MPRAECVITGCSLLCPDGLVAHGDLHIHGSSYVFNANVDENGDTAFFGNRALPNRLEPSEYFERRGVFVIDPSVANLSPEAVAYISKWSEPL